MADNETRFNNLILHCQPWQLTYVDGEREMIVNFSSVGDSLSERLICASVIDVSEIRSAERARAEMVDYLSHDLRSPLISALYLLEDAGGQSASSGDAVKRIELNIQRSLTMMDDLLHVARADSLTDDSFTELLFNSVLDNALDQLMPQARAEDIDLVVDTVDDDLWMDGDAASLERAVSNVIGNAIKYSPGGSSIAITLWAHEGYAVLDIRDQGIGIDPALAGQLFTRFKRDHKVAEQFQGIGLGLALVSRVVEQHSGSVRVGDADNGTLITMELPLKSIDEDASIAVG